MMNKFLVKLVTPLVMGIFIFACSESGGNSPSGGNAPDSSQAPANSGGQSSASGGGVNYFQLPLSPGVPPADVIQQITLNSRGGYGTESICKRNCIYVIQNTISLTYFQPNQPLRIDIYSPYNYPDYEFLTEIAVQTDNNGTLEIHIDRDPQFFSYIVLDQSGNEITKPDIVNMQYTQSSPECPGQLTSRLAVGMRVRVVSSNGTPLQLHWEPNANPESYLMDIDEGVEMKIIMGPQCNEGMIWWTVLEYMSSSSGWITEGDLELVK